MAVDPVALVRGPARGTATFRCRACGIVQRHGEVLPSGGVPCGRCGAIVNVERRVDYVGIKPRIVASVIDTAAFILPFVLLAFVSVPFDPLIAKDAHGHTTPHAMIVLRSVSGAYFAAYFWLTEALGTTFGKQFLGMRVVRYANWRRPGAIVGFLRASAKLVTIGTLGIGFAAIVFDPQRRALHDRVAGTRVVER